jgi:hypothetical protein
MEHSGTRETPPPTADIRTLHRELEQLFTGRQDGSREMNEKADDTSRGTCLVIKGK